MIYNIHTIIIDPKFQDLCKKAYYNHPKGCPNYGRKKECPPKQKMFFDVFDSIFYLIFIEFDLGTHVKRMQSLHPEWTDRQLRCCLYWQGTARKMLKEEIIRFKKLFPNHHVTDCPEAMGVNVTDLMKDNADIDLEWPPVACVRKVAIGGLIKLNKAISKSEMEE